MTGIIEYIFSFSDWMICWCPKHENKNFAYHVTMFFFFSSTINLLIWRATMVRRRRMSNTCMSPVLMLLYFIFVTIIIWWMMMTMMMMMMMMFVAMPTLSSFLQLFFIVILLFTRLKKCNLKLRARFQRITSKATKNCWNIHWFFFFKKYKLLATQSIAFFYLSKTTVLIAESLYF